MKKKIALLFGMLAVLACMLAISVSAAAYGSGNENGVTVRYFDSTVEGLASKTDDDAMFTSVWNKDSIITSYEGSFPKTNSNGDAISWYKLGDATQDDGDIYVAVASFATMDADYHTLGSDGMYKFITANGPTKQNIVSINFPNDAGVKSFSNGSHYGFFAQMGDYLPSKSELLFAYIPNTFTKPNRLVQATPVLEVVFDDDCAITAFVEIPFYGCQSLTKVNIPKNITKIGNVDDGNGCFQYCKSLSTVEFSKDIQLTTIGGLAFYEADSLIEFSVPNTVTEIGQRAFQSCDSLVTIKLGANLEKISGGSAVYLSHAVRYVYLSNSVTSINQHCFGTTQNGMGGSNMVFFYTGSKEEFATITISANNERLSNATITDYNASLGEQHYKDLATKENKCYVVCGFNECDAFYAAQHDMNGKATATVENYFEAITVGDMCKRCKNGVVLETIEPLFTWKGYTVSTFGKPYSMAQGFAVNNEAIAKYMEYVPSFEFGLIAAGNASGGEFSPDLNTDWCIKQGSIAHDSFDIKINGITSDYINKKIVFCAYVKTDEAVYYLDNNTSGKALTGISYKELNPNAE